MVKLINVRFGNVMFVSEENVDKYLAKGNRLADPSKAEPKKAPRKRKATVKK